MKSTNKRIILNGISAWKATKDCKLTLNVNVYISYVEWRCLSGYIAVLWGGDFHVPKFLLCFSNWVYKTFFDMLLSIDVMDLNHYIESRFGLVFDLNIS